MKIRITEVWITEVRISDFLLYICVFSDRKLWLSIIAAGVVGFGTPFAAVPVYSDLYKVAL